MEADKKQTTIATYDRTAQAMADKFNTIGARRSDIERVLHYTSKTDPKIVELGCGNGRDAAVILEFTNDYLGMDASEGMIELAKATVPHGRFVVADFDDFSFPPQTDVIFAFAALLHADKATFASVLSKAHKALTDNGLCFISIKYAPYQEHDKQDEFGKRTFYYYTESDIHQLIGTQYTILEENRADLRGQTWLDVLLQKA